MFGNVFLNLASRDQVQKRKIARQKARATKQVKARTKLPNLVQVRPFVHRHRVCQRGVSGLRILEYLQDTVQLLHGLLHPLLVSVRHRPLIQIDVVLDLTIQDLQILRGSWDHDDENRSHTTTA